MTSDLDIDRTTASAPIREYGAKPTLIYGNVLVLVVRYRGFLSDHTQCTGPATSLCLRRGFL